MSIAKVARLYLKQGDGQSRNGSSRTVQADELPLAALRESVKRLNESSPNTSRKNIAPRARSRATRLPSKSPTS